MKKTERIIFCCSPEDRAIIDKKVSDGHFISISEYVRFVALNATVNVNVNVKVNK